ncbi:RNHCP domain-containing protein [Patescibacteria group bacterium]
MHKSDHYICRNCRKEVLYKAPGTKNRNHCPFCLHSLHVDTTIGDRKSKCWGVMQPIGKMIKNDGEEVLVHECQKCGLVRKNRVAGDDDWDLVEKLSVVDFF